MSIPPPTKGVSAAGIICHTIVACCLLTGYIVLTVTGHDANPLLGALGGQGLGAIIQDRT